MKIDEIAKDAVSGVLKVARKPADLVFDRVSDNRVTSLVRQLLDRADAAARENAESALGDQGLKTQANEARMAADTRRKQPETRAADEEHKERLRRAATKAKAKKSADQQKANARRTSQRAATKADAERAEVLRAQAEASAGRRQAAGAKGEARGLKNATERAQQARKDQSG